MKPTDALTCLDALLRARQPFLLLGSPGSGKTALCQLAAQRAGFAFVLSHPSVDQPEDVKGLPFLRPDGGAAFVAFDAMRALATASAPTLCLLDDLPLASVGVQGALMQVVHARRIGELAVSPHVTFAAAGNRTEDKTGAGRLISALRSRFATILTLEPDVIDWLDYADAAGFHADILGYVRFTPSALVEPATDTGNFACPRTLEHASDVLKLGLPTALEAELLQGALGRAHGLQLAAYRRHAASLPSILGILRDPLAAPAVVDPGQRYAVVAALAAAVAPNTLGNALQYVARLGQEYVAVFATAACEARPGMSPARLARVALLAQSDAYVASIATTRGV